ncbi:MAG: homoserine dehydrogenase [Clostridia bacterium]|nr:homoserine dehydrogenase [Clostridia bacterium]
MQGLAIMGHGVVGSGVAELFFKNQKSIENRAGQEMELRHVLDLREFPGLPYSDKFTKDFNDILSDPKVSVVAEVMGGLKPAYDFVKQLLLAGKHVVTSNKELVAAKGAELLAIAKENNVNFLFEASVGGGIPILRPMNQCLAANTITEILGILNGTTNFIMTKMIKDGMAFDDALALAQELGYAERNPSADVDGHDACRKICILASLAYGKHVYPAQVETCGITKITETDVAFAKAYNSVIKLIGRTRMQEDGKIQCSVAPMLVSCTSPLSMVDDVFNAIMVRGDATGDVMFYGKGAGKLPTASAVMADMIDCVKHLNARKYVFWEEGTTDYVADSGLEQTAVYVHAKAADIEKAYGEINDLFGCVEVLDYPEAPAHEIAFITPKEPLSVIQDKIKRLSMEIEPLNVFRVCE